MGSSRPRNSTRVGKARSAKSLPASRRTPATPKRPSKFRTAPDVREIHDDDLPVTELRELRRKLELICSCAIVVEHALLEQNALLDDDAARVLKCYVGDELAALMAGIDSLLEGAKP
jgi:hypothetical protein